MKPTCIFTTQEHLIQYHSAAAKKKGLNNVHTFTSFTRNSAQPNENSELLHEVC
jgi:hypothetical protein